MFAEALAAVVVQLATADLPVQPLVGGEREEKTIGNDRAFFFSHASWVKHLL